MSGMIISVASGAKNDIKFGGVQGPMTVLMQDNHARFENDPLFNTWKKIFLEYGLESAMATIAGICGIGMFEDVGENGKYPMTDMPDGFTKLVSALEWKMGVSISQTAMEDKLKQVMQNNARTLTEGYAKTRCHFFWGLLSAALENRDYITKLGRKVSVKTMDGVNVFSTGHKLANAKGTVSNAFSDEFSTDSLGKVATRMQNMVDDNGEIIGMNPDTIFIPNTEDAKREVFGVLGATHDPDTPAGNKYNYQFGNWEVVTVPWLVPLVKNGKFPWMLMDSGYNESNYGARDVERVPLTVNSFINNDNDANVWSGRGRFGGAFIDFRAFAAGGVDFGTEA